MTSPFEAFSDAVLAIAAERSVAAILQRIVDAARSLVPTRYAAIGVPDGDGGFAQFVTSGMSDELRTAIGELPRTHGMLAAILEDPRSFRIRDIEDDPRFGGWWPSHHPRMRSMIGIPIMSRDEIIGAFYLTDREGEEEFSEEDEQLVRLLAAHAAIAIDNARLHERSRELSVIEERNRLARELHDALAQRLFGATMTARSARILVERDPARAAVELDRLQELVQGAAEEMRALVFELRPAELEADGLEPTLRKHVDVLRRALGAEIVMESSGAGRPAPRVERALFRIAHAAAGSIRVELGIRDGAASLSITDDGVGFDPDDPALRSGHLGLTSMRERAEEIGARFAIDSSPGGGTTVHVEAPCG